MSITNWKDYQKQYSIVQREDGSLSFADLTRFALVLPPELTSLIFLFCLPEYEFNWPDATTAPLVLLQVCRLWRQIALSTPGLWASVYIDWDSFYDTQDLETHLRDWISRAKSMPLSIKMHDRQEDDAQLVSVLQMIGDCSAQWRNVSSMPIVKILHSYFQLEPDSPCCTNWFWSAISGSVNPPRSSYWKLIRVPWSALVLPCQSIEVFGSQTITVRESVDVLRELRSLTCCTFYLVFQQPPPSITPLGPIVNLKDLTVLEMADDTLTPPLVMDLLRHLTLPALKHLTLKFEDPYDRPPTDITEFFSFATRSSFQLETLTLCLMPASEQELLRCLYSVYLPSGHSGFNSQRT
ncbi:hypothetical protein FB45DRAFT_1061406 [Roridomyces roridus]|uniref:F-box domain-containing protein n=1 Tax=Roridomyces roridus TaxID=1738132 RepID=A0AAD7BK64_9AGAR|nr:hypothetical protein FB45DRAFT_1061406 [Roridomyces roridus]